MTQPEPVWQKPLDLKGVVADITDRGISASIAEKYGVTVTYAPDGRISSHHYPLYDADTGELVASKVRVCAEKSFYFTGVRPTTLFGHQTIKGRGKFITITEGEVDALSVSQIFGGKWDVVSLTRGAEGARDDIQKNLELLESYDKVVLCFDNDAAGRKAIDSVKDLFGPNKLLIMTIPSPYKDANAMLVARKGEEFMRAWWDAKLYCPDGIVAGDSTWDAIINQRAVKSIPYPWAGLNALTRGHRTHELVTITSGSGMGKSALVRELEYSLLKVQEDNIGILALEENVARSALGVMSIEANRPLHLEEDTPPEVLRPYWEATLGTGRFYLFDHFGSTSEDNLFSRLRYMIKGLDCRTVFLDHLSIIVSSQEHGGDERRAIDAIMTKLRTLVQETGVRMFLVAHLSKASGSKSHEEGGRISLNELRGSKAIAQLSDIVIGLERDQQHPDELVRNTTCVRVLKNRYSGQTGPACWLRYDTYTGRLSEVDNPTTEDTL